ncbi:MAG: hypothetical protein ABEJ23_08975 [Haloarculaceae archaeon]
MAGRSRPGGVPVQVVVLAAVVLAVVGASMLAPAVTGGASAPQKTAADVHLVEPAPNSSQELWPFTSREQRFESLTLPINLVFETDAVTTRYLLTSEGDENWENQTARRQGNVTVRLNVSANPPETNGTRTTGEPATTGPTGGRTTADATTLAGEPTVTTAPGGPNATTRPGESSATPTSAPATPTGSASPRPAPTGPNATETGANATTTRANATGTGPNATTATPDSGPDIEIVINGTELGWEQTHGGTRYTYVQHADGTGQWITPAYQLHNGDYFGSRAHLRLYEGGSEGHEWTAVQAHREHWDWFGLRHSVDSLSRPQHQLERQFYGKWYVTDVSRQRYANGGALDYGGWVSVVGFRDNVVVPPRLLLFPLAGLTLAGGAASALAASERGARRLWESEQVGQAHVWLFLVVTAIPLAVRSGAVAVERAFPQASPILVGGPFYLLLVVGLPVAAWRLARPLDQFDAFVVTAVALGTGVMADYAAIGVTLLKFGVLLHRVAALAALGTVAAGSAIDAEEDWRAVVLAVGVLAWAAVVLGPVAGIR